MSENETPKTPNGQPEIFPVKFDHYQLQKRLGSGGMGTAYLALDEKLGRNVAVKVMQPELGADPAAFEAFVNEARSAASLSHANIAQIYSFGQFEGCPYLEMELLSGGDLAYYITHRVKLDPAFVIRVGYEIAQALRAAEEKSLYHGDVKPDNILFDENNVAKLVDFGIASHAAQGASNEVWGTPFYIAPEKVQKKMNTARSDIYSLGATLYHAITLAPPFDGADAAEVVKARFGAPPRPMDQLRPDVEPEVSRIISRMMFRDLFQRYPTYSALLGDMKRYLDSVPDARKAGPAPSEGAAANATSATSVVVPPIVSQTASAPAVSAAPAAAAAAPAAAPAAGGKKKIVIKKKGGAPTVSAPAVPAAGGDAAAAATTTSSRPKIVLHKKGGSPTVSAKPVAPADAENDLIAEGIPEGAAAGDAPAIKIKPKKKSVNPVKVILFTIVGFVALILIGIFAFIGVKISETKRDARLQAAMVRDADEVLDQYVALPAQFQTCLKKAKSIDEQMTKVIAKADEWYFKATNDHYTLPDIEPEPEVVEVEPTEDDATVEATPAADAAAPAPAAPAADGAAAAPAAAAAPEAPKKKLPPLAQLARKQILEELGEDNPSSEQLFPYLSHIKAAAKEAGKTPEEYAIEQLGDEYDGPKPEPKAEAAAPAEDTAPAEDAPAADDGNAAADGAAAAIAAAASNPVLAVIEKEFLDNARTIRLALRRAEAYADEGAFEIFDAFPQNAQPNVIAAGLAARQKAYGKAMDRLTRLQGMIADAEKALKAMTNSVKNVQRAAQPIINKIAREAAEAEAKAAEEEKQRKIEEEKREKEAEAAAEVDSVKENASKHNDKLLKYQYEEYVKALKRMESELQTDEGREELKFALKRAQYLIDLRKWIIEDLKKNGKLTRGYKNRTDILGVSVNGKDILLGGGQPNVPIASLTMGDWVSFFRPLLENRPPARQGLDTKTRANMLFAAAVFCYVHGDGDSRANDRCIQIAKQAYTLAGGLRNDAARIVPILVEQTEEGGDGAAAGQPSEAAMDMAW